MIKTDIKETSRASHLEGSHVRFQEIDGHEVIQSNSPSSNPSTNESDSSEERLSGKPKKRARVSLGSGGFAVSESRGRTEVGRQVEHVSAYVLFEELIYSALEDTKIKSAPENLSILFSRLPLPTQALKEIQDKAQAVEETISLEERKLTTRSIRGSNYLSNRKGYLTALVQVRENSVCDEEEKHSIEESLNGLQRITTIDVASVKYSLKLANRANFSSVVAGIMDDCLFGANKMVYASFPSEGVPTNPNTGKEKTAKDTLKLFSEFLITIERANRFSRNDQAKYQAKATTMRDEIHVRIRKQFRS